jgi:hypothetical protein
MELITCYKSLKKDRCAKLNEWVKKVIMEKVSTQMDTLKPTRIKVIEWKLQDGKLIYGYQSSKYDNIWN